MEQNLLVTPSPHLNSGETVRAIMLDVLIALLPAAVASGIIFGARALLTIFTCVLSCVACEYICRKAMRRENTVGDLSAVVTGMLLAFTLPAEINPVYAVIGSVVAIAAVKQVFGGIGQNFVNPALTARIVLMVSFPADMNTWVNPFYYRTGAGDAVTTATPLEIIKHGGEQGLPSVLDLLVGNRGGCLGETCAAALILGGLYLIARRVISPAIPAVFIGTVAAGTYLLGGNPVLSILSGGVLLGAVFMATDYTTSPLHLKGKLIFAFGCGAITVLIRAFGALPEGVSYAIIMMNILVPLIERVTIPKPWGEDKHDEKA